MKNKGIVLKLYPNREQQNLLECMFGSDRFVWNQLLSMINERYRNNPSLKLLSAYDMNYLLKPLKQEYPFLKSSDSSSLQVVSSNLYQAWMKFFKDKSKKTGKPRFHSKRATKKSYTGKSTTIKVVKKRYINVPKLGIIKCSNTKALDNCKIKRYTVSKDSTNNYYISLIVEFENQELTKTGKVVGIDLGTHDLLITSDGYKEPKLVVKRFEKRVKIWQRKFNRRKNEMFKTVAFNNHNQNKLYQDEMEYHSNWQKARIMKAKWQKKIKNIRLNKLHQITTQLVKQYDVIVIENLQSSNMMKNHHLASSIANASWHQLRTMLQYKCDWYGKQLIIVDPKNTSRICSSCGFKNDEFNRLTTNQWLATRKWTCPNCNNVHDRDINASINILNRGLKQNIHLG